MIRHPARPAAVAAMALLIALALVGCGQHKATQAPSATPQATLSQAPTTASPLESNGASPSGSGSTAPPGSASASATASVPATPDPVASELDKIDQLINDINSSISGSDSSQQSGE